MDRSETLLTGAAIGMALLDATAAQARPLISEGLGFNIRATPASTGDAYQTGRGLLAAGDVTGAMAAFRQTLIASPQSVDALNGLGVCYDRLGRYDISRGYYDSALAIDPNSALVLNNLGYSLYLQGAYSAAIPVLQRAANTRDAAVAAASQRVLTMVAAQMREASARASYRETLAEIATPQAHIELAANGEQRLVLGAPRPDRALVAALGDDAGLVTIAQPADATTRQQAVARAAETTTATARVATANVDRTDDGHGDLPVVVYLAGSTANTTRTLTVSVPDTGRPAVAATRISQPATTGFAVASAAITAGAGNGMVAIPVPSRLAHRPRPIAPRRDEPLPIILTAADVTNSHAPDPAWLLTSRRTDRTGFGRSPADRRRDGIDAVVAFDSDLADLNRFAARLRGQPITRRADPDAERDAAVAKLEALIARIRAA